MNIKEVLDRLSMMSVEEIESELIKENITGKPSVSCACPISNYIFRLTKHICYIYTDKIIDPGDSDHIYYTPSSVSYFITKFDQGYCTHKLYQQNL